MLLGGAAATWPFNARAQQSSVPVVGFLNSRASGENNGILVAFRQGLKEAGYVEGQNVTVQYRWAGDQYDRLPAMAADLVGRHVDVIVSNGPSIKAAQAATSTIPIVFVVGFDPLAFGLVSSVSRPDGNLTGVSGLDVEIGPKRLELLHELIPTATVTALLVNPTTPAAEAITRDVQTAARPLGVQLHVLYAATDHDLDAVFETLTRLRADALIIGGDRFFTSRSRYLGELSAAHRLPAIYEFHEFVAAGGLVSYGASVADAYRQAGIYTGRILQGEKPSDLPVQQAMKVELILNLKTAKTLGINVPNSLLGRADEVIE